MQNSKKEAVLRREVGQEGQRVRLTVRPGQAAAVSSATTLSPLPQFPRRL